MNLFRKTLAQYSATKARKIVVDAECVKQIWVRMGIPKSKVEVIPFGVDTNLFNPNVDGSGIRKKLGIRENDVAIISTRPFFPHYDIECLIKAVPAITEKHQNVKFIIKGKGPLEDSIRKLAQKLRVEQFIRFSYPVPYHEMAHYLKAADIYVSTSFVDSTSVTLLEAMACGMPPVTTDIPGNREWIKNEVNGLLYPPKDHRALAEKITQLIENENQRKQFGEKNHQIIEEKAAWEKCVSKMESIYDSLL
jgi:glycosyltransferase involved in cell wall biosynthesis